MQIILMEKIDNLGSLGEIVNVKAGYTLVNMKLAFICTLM